MHRIHTPAQVQSHLDRVLASTTFTTAPVLSRLLEFLVRQSLSGKASALKEYTVGVEVFGRGTSFDPRTDTIVRVQARRLRIRLEEYYAGPGQWDAIRIDVPNGHYAVEFLHAQEGAPPDSSALPSDVEGSLSWLPAFSTELIGRHDDIQALSNLLLGDTRLLTLTGAGGSGKTRLAIRVSELLADQFPAGVFFAPLASITDPEAVLLTLARILGLRQTQGKALTRALQDYLHLMLHAPALLLIDNFEQVLPAAPVVATLLEASAYLKILVTSRAVLQVYGEREYPVHPLSLPDSDSLTFPKLAHNPAVRLFAERASAVDPTFSLSETNASDIAAICARLDGLPLAIELAAARIRVSTPAVMLKRLEKPLLLLTGGPEGLTPRHQTLRRTIEWSHHLLDEHEQRLFRRLSVFAGGCTLEAAEAVCNTRLDLGISTTDGLESLSGKSLLVRSRTTDGELRFTMLETIREYALGRLEEAGEEDQVRQAHGAYYVVVAEESYTKTVRDQREKLFDAFDAEHANFRSAFSWLVSVGNRDWALRLVNALFFYWERREQLPEARTTLLTAINMHDGQPPSDALAVAIDRVAAIAICQGDLQFALKEHERSLAMYQQLGNKRGVALQWDSLGATNQVQGDLEASWRCYEQSLRAYEELELPVESAATMCNLANIAHATGDSASARELLHEALQTFASRGLGASAGAALNRLGDISADAGDLTEAARLYIQSLELYGRYDDRFGTGRCYTDLGYVKLRQGDAEAAHRAFCESLHAFAALQHGRGIARALEGLASMATKEEQFDRALLLAGAAAGIRHRSGAPLRPADLAKLDSSLEAARQALGAAKAEATLTAGWRISTADAIELGRRRDSASAATGN